MNLEFKTGQIDAQSILGIRTTTTMDRLAEIMGPLFGEIYGYIQRSGQAPAGIMAMVTHMGPYDNLGETWNALMQWIESNDLQPAHAPWEVYVTDPGAEADPSKWRTDIFFPVQDCP